MKAACFSVWKCYYSYIDLSEPQGGSADELFTVSQEIIYS